MPLYKQKKFWLGDGGQKSSSMEISPFKGIVWPWHRVLAQQESETAEPYKIQRHKTQDPELEHKENTVRIWRGP